MSTVEMGAYGATVVDGRLDEGNNDVRVQTAFGRVKVSIYGEPDAKNNKKIPIVTFHDLGLDSENNFQNFFQFGALADFTDRFCVYNINAPGQEMDAQPLPESYVYPSMEGLAKIVETVCDFFELKHVVCLGVGAGANVLLRFALSNEKRISALILVNCVTSKPGWIEWGYQKMNVSYLRSQRGMTAFTVDYLLWHHLGKRLDSVAQDIVRQYRVYFAHHPNPANLAAFIESYIWRSPIIMSREDPTLRLRVPVLQIVGSGSSFHEETVELNALLDPANSEYVKISDSCGLVLDDRPDAVTEALLLFLQGQGYLTSVNVPALMRRVQTATSVLGGSGSGGISDPCATSKVTVVAED